MILGITGGTGCGKTTLLKQIALKQIASLGGRILDCDAIYHQLLETDTTLLHSIEAQFPGTVENGVLLRKKLGSQVFSNPEALERLNQITHAAVYREVQRQLADQPPLAAIDAIALFESGLARLCQCTVAVTAPLEVYREVQRQLADQPPLAAIDAIALFESGLARLCQCTVAVTAPLEDRVQRLMARDGISRDYARSRIAAQHPPEWFASRCDYVLENNASEAAFQKNCLAFLARLDIIKETKG